MTQTQAGPATEAGQKVLLRVVYLYDEVESPESDDVKYVADTILAIEQEAAVAEARRTIDVLRPFLIHADDCALPRQNFCDCGLDARLADEGVPA